LSFANSSDPFLATGGRPERSGAIVEVVWPLDRISAESGGPLGENQPLG
jgi:two-component system sensor histidine kinase RegB